MSSEIIPLLQFGIYIIIGIIFLLVLLYLYLMKPKSAPKEKEHNQEINDSTSQEKRVDQNYGRFTGNLTQESIFDFMEFEDVKDNMILQKGGKRFLMAIECQGVNYDLMSDVEKTSLVVVHSFSSLLSNNKFKTLSVNNTLEIFKESISLVLYASKFRTP